MICLMTSTAAGPSRRQVVVGAGVGVCAIGLAACAGGSASEPAIVQPSPEAPLASISDIAVGSAVAVTTAEGVKLLVTHPADGEVHAFSAVCTHQGCTVLADGDELRCPCHASVFALTNAAVLAGPAPVPLPEIPVRLEEGDIYLA